MFYVMATDLRIHKLDSNLQKIKSEGRKDRGELASPLISVKTISFYIFVFHDEDNCKKFYHLTLIG